MSDGLFPKCTQSIFLTTKENGWLASSILITKIFFLFKIKLTFFLKNLYKSKYTGGKINVKFKIV